MNARFFFIITERSDSAIHLEITKDLDNIHLASASYITLQDCVPSQKRLADFHIYFSNSAGHGGIVALASYHTYFRLCFFDTILEHVPCFVT